MVARRWDQLGGRLNAIVNAASVAELLGLDFGFVWPRGYAQALDNPEEIFSARYLDAFELDASELEGRPAIPSHELLALSDTEARRLLGGTPGAIVEVDQPFDIAQASWEEAGVARARLKQSWSEFGWREEVGELLRQCQDVAAAEPLVAVHVRAGDIVDGDWCQVMHHEKYLPSPFIELAIESLLREQVRVLILSDNDEYLRRLRDRFASAVTAAELVPGYERLSALHQALADIFLLAHCREIVGPPSSAFSQLAAKLGPERIVRADELVSPGHERDVLLAAIAERLPDAETPAQRRLLARDACWCLDVFSDDLAPDNRLRLARDAVELDGGFSGAATRLARIAVIAGELPAAQAANARALSLAEPVEQYDDALFEALATDVVVSCFTAILSPPRSALRWAPRRTRERREREEHERAELCLSQIQRSFDRCLTLDPIWSVRESVCAALQELIDVVRWCLQQPPPMRRRVAEVLVPGRGPLPAASVSFSSLDDHRSAAMYDPLTRDLDRILWQIKAALEPLRAGRRD